MLSIQSVLGTINAMTSVLVEEKASNARTPPNIYVIQIS